MSLSARLLIATLLAFGLAGPGVALATEAPRSISCEVDWGGSRSVVTVYRLDRSAGRVTGEADAIFTTAGATQGSERMTIVRTIESWTDEELVLRAEYRSKVRDEVSTIRNIIDLRTLTTRTQSARVSSVFTPTPSEHKGTCQVVPLDAAAEKDKL
jgi:hypothetical protein